MPPPENPFLARILVIDDSAENVRVLTRVLKRGGYTEVSGLTDPRSALGVIKEIAPALVIVDLHMPHCDGYAVMDAVRGQVRPGPRFLLVTGESDGGVRAEAALRGADDVLTKPFKIADVLERVGVLLER